MLLATALALLITGCMEVYCSKQTGSSSTGSSPIISSFLELGEENCRCSQNLWRRKMLLKQKQQTFVNGLLGFMALALSTLEALCIAHNNCMSCPSIWATLSAAH